MHAITINILFLSTPMTEKFKAASIYGNRHYPRIVYGPKIEELPEVVRVELADGTQRDYFPESQEGEENIAFSFVAEWEGGQKELFRITNTGRFEFNEGIEIKSAARKFAEFFNQWMEELEKEDREPWEEERP